MLGNQSCREICTMIVLVRHHQDSSCFQNTCGVPAFASARPKLLGMYLQFIMLLLLFSCSVMSASLRLPWTVARQAPLSMGFPRQEYWNVLLFPSPGNLPDPGIQLGSPVLADGFFTSEPPGKPNLLCRFLQIFQNVWSYLNIVKKSFQVRPHLL